MADDKMKNDDLNPGGSKQAGQPGQGGQGGQQPGQQTPGRNPNEEQSGQKGGQGTGRGLEDDELGQGNRGTNINEPKGREQQNR
jgi:hypothetical protein